MEFSAEQIANLLSGTIEGNREVKVNTLAKIEEGHNGALSFLANPKYAQYIYNTDASIVIVNEDFALEKPVKDSCTLIRVKNAYECFAKLLEMYNEVKNNKTGIEKEAKIVESATVGDNCYVGAFSFIGENVKIGNNVKIYPNCYIGDNSTVGDNTTIFAGVNIYSETIIGKECTIHSGAIIGADGFGFAPNSENNYQKVAQIGNVIIEDHVEIGANTCIDRATLGSTIIKKGVKLDNLIQVAHNVVVGENTVIAAQTGIAGSTKMGKNGMVGGQVGIVGHLNLADGIKIAAQSGIQYSVEEENTILQGSPAFDVGQYRRSYVGFRKLPDLMKQLKELELQIEALKAGTE